MVVRCFLISYFFAPVKSGSSGSLEPTWANLGPTWANLGPTWGQLGANLGPTWGQVGPPEGVFFARGQNDENLHGAYTGACFSVSGEVQDRPRFGPKFFLPVVLGARGYFEAVFTPLEASSGRLGADLGPTWGQLGAPRGSARGSGGGPKSLLEASGAQEVIWRPFGPRLGAFWGSTWGRKLHVFEVC